MGQAIRRRTFLRSTLAGATAVSLYPQNPLLALPQNVVSPKGRRIDLDGVHAYADQESVEAGKSIRFFVSSTVPYSMAIFRLGSNPNSPDEDTRVDDLAQHTHESQPIFPGSYIWIRNGLGAMEALTLEAWIRPWKASGRGAIFSQGNDLALLLNPDGTLIFRLGNEDTSTSPVLPAGKWSHVVASWDGHRKTLWVEGQKKGEWDYAGVLTLSSGALQIGAGGADGQTTHLLDADIAMPVIYGRSLSPDEVQGRYAGRGLRPARGKSVLGCWPLDEERGNKVRDISPERREGHIINFGTWMIGGPSFEAEVPRFGDYQPRRDPKRGHGLRLASDDLYDCGWKGTHAWKVPADARPGLHVARLSFELDGKPHLYPVTFNVRRSARRKRPAILVLCASNTWRAYSGTPFAMNKPELKQVWGTGGGPELPSKPPAFNFYRNHAAGQGTYQMGLRMPWPAAGPYIRYGDKTDYSHLMRAERFFHIWLEKSGYDFDVVMDSDLHRDPGMLRKYKVFVINGHSEYWSMPMYKGLEDYLRRGGQTVVLSGNSLFWRVSYNADGTILECRKVDAPGEQLPAQRRGECWHTHDWQRGGLLRECGAPGWKLIGLETLGWNNQNNPANFGPYIAEKTDHFLFHHPEQTGLTRDEKFGWAGENKMPMANGHEFDVRLSTLAALQEKPSPSGTSMPSDPRGMVRLANGIIPWKQGGSAFDYFFRAIKPKTDQGGEMIYWERPEGGKVFNAGSIGAGWAIGADPKFQTLMRNVLAHFGVQRGSR